MDGTTRARFRTAVLGFALLGAGFLGGIAYSMAEIPAPLEQSDVPDRLTPLLFEKVAALDQRMQDQRVEILAALSASRRGDRTRAADTASAAGRPESASSASSAESVARLGSRTLRPADSEHLAAVETWKTDGDVRRRWLFGSESDVTDWFGTPDEVNADSGGEWWTYWKVADAKIVRRCRFRISSGRVIDFNTWEEPKPIPVPAGSKR